MSPYVQCRDDEGEDNEDTKNEGLSGQKRLRGRGTDGQVTSRVSWEHGIFRGPAYGRTTAHYIHLMIPMDAHVINETSQPQFNRRLPSSRVSYAREISRCLLRAYVKMPDAWYRPRKRWGIGYLPPLESWNADAEFGCCLKTFQTSNAQCESVERAVKEAHTREASERPRVAVK